jgi:hypothetical protein
MLKQTLGLLSLSLALLLPTHAQAANVTGNSSGVWTMPGAPVGVVATGLGTRVITNGQGLGAPPDAISFTGNVFSSDFDTPFKLGSISYFNGATAAGTAAASISLGLTLAFTNPAIPAVLSDFIFNFTFTPNSGNATASADFMYLPSSFSSTLFTIGNTNYQVQIDGFQNIVGDGFLVSDPLQLHVLEGYSATADIFGRVVATDIPVNDVPEPSALALLVVAVMGAAASRRKAV